MSDTNATGIAIVGCGYVADAYRQCLDDHPQLRLTGAYDRDAARLASYTTFWGIHPYRSLDDLLADASCDIVVNLTTPESHVSVSTAALKAGKHVYSEKPLAMTVGDAKALRSVAQDSGRRLAAAPCNILSESAQTIWKAVNAGLIGRVMLAYAELDDGMIHRTAYRDWKSASGSPWPARDEFATGCTYEHAGYALVIFAALFGPVRRATTFSALLIPDKGTDIPLPHPAPDFSVGLLDFDHGIVARLTNSIVAPYDHRMRIVGENGVIEIREPWDYASPVVLRRPAQGRLQRLIERRWGGLRGERLRPIKGPPRASRWKKPTMDFMRGVAELAEAIRQGRRCRLDADLAVHLTEVTEILQYPERFDRPAVISSTFAPMEPLDWSE